MVTPEQIQPVTFLISLNSQSLPLQFCKRVKHFPNLLSKTIDSRCPTVCSPRKLTRSSYEQELTTKRLNFKITDINLLFCSPLYTYCGRVLSRDFNNMFIIIISAGCIVDLNKTNDSFTFSVYGASTYHCKLKTEQRIKLYGCPFS